MKKPLVLVRMLVDTAYQGPRKTGDEVRVPEDFANRWVKNKIAELVGTVPTEPEVNVEPETVEEETPAIDYEGMTAKELYELCQESGLDVEAKKTKAYYIAKLTATEE